MGCGRPAASSLKTGNRMVFMSILAKTPLAIDLLESHACTYDTQL